MYYYAIHDKSAGRLLIKALAFNRGDDLPMSVQVDARARHQIAARTCGKYFSNNAQMTKRALVFCQEHILKNVATDYLQYGVSLYCLEQQVSKQEAETRRSIKSDLARFFDGESLQKKIIEIMDAISYAYPTILLKHSLKAEPITTYSYSLELMLDQNIEGGLNSALKKNNIQVSTNHDRLSNELVNNYLRNNFDKYYENSALNDGSTEYELWLRRKVMIDYINNIFSIDMLTLPDNDPRLNKFYQLIDLYSAINRYLPFSKMERLCEICFMISRSDEKVMAYKNFIKFYTPEAFIKLSGLEDSENLVLFRIAWAKFFLELADMHPDDVERLARQSMDELYARTRFIFDLCYQNVRSAVSHKVDLGPILEKSRQALQDYDQECRRREQIIRRRALLALRKARASQRDVEAQAPLNDEGANDQDAVCYQSLSKVMAYIEGRRGRDAGKDTGKDAGKDVGKGTGKHAGKNAGKNAGKTGQNKPSASKKASASKKRSGKQKSRQPSAKALPVQQPSKQTNENPLFWNGASESRLFFAEEFPKIYERLDLLNAQLKQVAITDICVRLKDTEPVLEAMKVEIEQNTDWSQRVPAALLDQLGRFSELADEAQAMLNKAGRQSVKAYNESQKPVVKFRKLPEFDAKLRKALEQRENQRIPGKRYGGEVSCPLDNSQWMEIYQQYHGYILSDQTYWDADANQMKKMEYDRCLALYVTQSSHSGALFDISVHEFRLRNPSDLLNLVTLAAPAAGAADTEEKFENDANDANDANDEKTEIAKGDALPSQSFSGDRINNRYYYDTLVPYLVLHIPKLKK